MKCITVFTENLTKYSLLTILSDNLKALDASASKKLTILSFPQTQLVCKQRAKCRRRTKLVERVVHGRHIGLFRGFAKETKTFLLRRKTRNSAGRRWKSNPRPESPCQESWPGWKSRSLMRCRLYWPKALPCLATALWKLRLLPAGTQSQVQGQILAGIPGRLLESQ